MSKRICPVCDCLMAIEVVPGSEGMGEELWYCPTCKIGELKAEVERLTKAGNDLCAALGFVILRLHDVADWIDGPNPEVKRAYDELRWLEMNWRSNYYTGFEDVRKANVELQEKIKLLTKENADLLQENERLLVGEHQLRQALDEWKVKWQDEHSSLYDATKKNAELRDNTEYNFMLEQLADLREKLDIAKAFHDKFLDYVNREEGGRVSVQFHNQFMALHRLFAEPEAELKEG